MHQNTHSDARISLASRPDLIAMMEEKNVLDLQLYAHAKEIAQERVAALEH